MNRIVATTVAMAFALSAASPLFAADKSSTKTPEQICKAQAKKQHVSKSKLDAYLKTCVEKHTKSGAN